MPQKYALIIGNGRSGTNWLLSMLDASPKTHCRNEPHDIVTSPFHNLPSAQTLQADPNEMAERWEHFTTWTGTHMGERDHRIKFSKHHVYPLSQRLGVAYWPVRPKIRTALKLFHPSLRQGEWHMPWWIGSQRQLEQSYAIFKINDFRAWYTRWLLQERPQVPVVHLARHPGGQLNSGIKRFFSELSEPELAQEEQLYKGILKTAVALEPQWQDVFGNIDKMELIEAVAWFWRYNNEAIFESGKHYDNYMFITYEQLITDPISYAKRLYQHCNLDWNADIETAIMSGLSTSVWGKLSKDAQAIANSWKKSLDPNYQAIAARVLKGSTIEHFWDEARLSDVN